MAETEKKTNRLGGETSPYLLEHALNPVDWFPWGEEAFEKARKEDKPVFLSVGYSTCHWCHVMARESFEDGEVARVLNEGFVPIKVDREERPDVDSVYMLACETMTGNGGWPLSVFMDAAGKPFYAGTYFPRRSFLKLLASVRDAWENGRTQLLRRAEKLAGLISSGGPYGDAPEGAPIRQAVQIYKRNFDPQFGGFGNAPKFPAPHNLMFLMSVAPELAEKTLACMFRGGMFDHVGGGFCRYSTDRFWLVPHFEKMLYDNALIAMAYLTAFEASEKPLYRSVAERIFQYLEREMRAPDGGFFSAQDADSEGVEGKYYVFTPDEIIALLGEEDGARFSARYGITPVGNFEGGSIPNLIGSDDSDAGADALIPKVYDYRRQRVPPHTDKKKLTAWNALAAAAYAMAARILKHDGYAETAKETISFIERELAEGDALYVGTTEGKRSAAGFLPDYAYYIFALIQAYEATLEEKYLSRAAELATAAWRLFWDGESGGFYFSGENNESLIARPKESYDGAMPSGNSVMAYNLIRLALLTEDAAFGERARLQSAFMNRLAAAYPTGYGFYLYAALPVKKIICATNDKNRLRALRIRSDWAFRLLDNPEYPILDSRTTYYVCDEGGCRPPTHEL